MRRDEPKRGVRIAPLPAHSAWIDEIARKQFAHWGRLTGFPSEETYAGFLAVAASGADLPVVLVASEGDRMIGSVNLVASDMGVRPDLTPWLAQLFVEGSERGQGTGRRLVAAAIAQAATLGFQRLYLYTSGTLPAWYRSQGWRDLEEVNYLGRRRMIMDMSAPR